MGTTFETLQECLEMFEAYGASDISFVGPQIIEIEGHVYEIDTDGNIKKLKSSQF